MKKLLIGLVAALLAASGLVTATTTTAVAGPYTGTVETTPKSTPKEARPFHAKIKVVISPEQGKKDPEGTLVFTFVSKRTGKVQTFRVNVADGPNFVFDGLAPGRYKVGIKYKPREGSKWQDSSDSVNVTVKGKGKKR